MHFCFDSLFPQVVEFFVRNAAVVVA